MPNENELAAQKKQKRISLSMWMLRTAMSALAI